MINHLFIESRRGNLNSFAKAEDIRGRRSL